MGYIIVNLNKTNKLTKWLFRYHSKIVLKVVLLLVNVWLLEYLAIENNYMNLRKHNRLTNIISNAKRNYFIIVPNL